MKSLTKVGLSTAGDVWRPNHYYEWKSRRDYGRNNVAGPFRHAVLRLFGNSGALLQGLKALKLEKSVAFDTSSVDFGMKLEQAV
jgi:hypothetical protein